MGIGSRLKKAFKKFDDQASNQQERSLDPNRGSWSSNQYVRLAESFTGAPAFKKAVAERKQQYRAEGFTAEGIGGGLDYQDGKDALRTMRPGISYKDNVTAVPEREAAAEDEMRQAEAAAVFARQKDLQAKFDAGQVAARIRRGRRADQPGTKGGTLKTSGLGSAGGQVSFAQLLGL